ncbi:MAG: hypothetical protein V4598_01045 [Bdellovibrionota bacterium]
MKTFLLAAFFLVSCASEDMNDNTAQTEKTPFFKRYKKRNKELLYIAVNEKGNVDTATMTLIDETVKKFDPEIIVAKYSVHDPNTIVKELSQCEQNLGCTPSAWACYIAKPRGIPCYSGEPFDSDIMRRIVNKKILSDEILFFYTYRQLVRKSKGVEKPLTLLPDIIEEEKKILNLASRFDKDEFILMYKDKMGSSLIKLGFTDLKSNRNGNYLQRLAWLVRKAHDDLVLEKIEKEQLDHERVMVIYGVEHYKKQVVPLEDFFSSHLP